MLLNEFLDSDFSWLTLPARISRTPPTTSTRHIRPRDNKKIAKSVKANSPQTITDVLIPCSADRQHTKTRAQTAPSPIDVMQAQIEKELLDHIAHDSAAVGKPRSPHQFAIAIVAATTAASAEPTAMRWLHIPMANMTPVMNSHHGNAMAQAKRQARHREACIPATIAKVRRSRAMKNTWILTSCFLPRLGSYPYPPVIVAVQRDEIATSLPRLSMPARAGR